MGRSRRPSQEWSFTERHPALALALTVLGLVVLGITTGEALGRLAVELLDLALAQLSAQR